MRLTLRPREALAFRLFEGVATVGRSLVLEEELTRGGAVADPETSLAVARVVLVDRLGEGESVARGLISRLVGLESMTSLQLPRRLRRPRGGPMSVDAEGVDVVEEILVRGDMSLYAGEFMCTNEGRLRDL